MAAAGESVGGRSVRLLTGLASGAMRANRLSALLAASAVMLMMAVGVIDIVSTQLFRRPMPGAYELVETAMVAAIFLSLAIAQAQRNHVHVEILVDRLRPRARAVFDVFSHLASTLVYALIAWYGWDAAIVSIRVGEFTAGLIAFPLWPAKLCLAFGASLAVVQCAVDAASSLVKAFGRERSVEP